MTTTDEHESDIDETIYPIYNIQKYLDNANYSLGCDMGSELWKQCEVQTFIKKHKFTAFQMVSECKAFSKINCYIEYEKIYGFGSFLEEIYGLAYESPETCLNFCKLAKDFGNKPKLNFCTNQKCKYCEHKRNERRFPFLLKDLEILNEFDEKSKYFNVNLQQYDQYCVGEEKGAKLWDVCGVHRSFPQLDGIIFDIVSNCNKFSNICCFFEYLDTYQEGSLYEDVFELSYDSPYICIKICQIAYEYSAIQVIKDSLSIVGIDSDTVSIITHYVCSNQYIDVFLGDKQEIDIISKSTTSLNCKYCGDYMKQYELGTKQMDSFCVGCDDGYNLWHLAKVEEFIRAHPRIAFGVASHCKIFDKYLDYKDFEKEYGTDGLCHENELYSQLFILAYESPYICLKLCEASIWNYCFDEWTEIISEYEIFGRLDTRRIMSISLYEERQLRYSLQEIGIMDCLIDIIGSYLFEEKRKDCILW